jgi:hypothetical protein
VDVGNDCCDDTAECYKMRRASWIFRCGLGCTLGTLAGSNLEGTLDGLLWFIRTRKCSGD